MTDKQLKKELKEARLERNDAQRSNDELKAELLKRDAIIETTMNEIVKAEELDMGQQLAVLQAKNMLMAFDADFSEGGWDQEQPDSTDIIIPKILLMHPTSELVKAGERSQGEIIRSTDNMCLSHRNEKFEICVFEKWKEWRIMRKNQQTGIFEFVRLDKWAPSNDHLAWEFEENGEVMRRDKTLNFYGLLAKDPAFPVKISFTRTSYKQGAKIADGYAKAIMLKRPPVLHTWKIGTELIKGKAQTYFGFTVEMGTTTPDVVKAEAVKWKKIISNAKAQNLVIDDEEKTDTESSSTETVDQF